MTTYLVRSIETKQALGIYTSSTMRGLFDLIDEIISPYETEFCISTFGAIHFGKKPVTFDVDVDIDELDDDDSLTVSLSGDFVDATTFHTGRRWKTFPEHFHWKRLEAK